VQKTSDFMGYLYAKPYIVGSRSPRKYIVLAKTQFLIFFGAPSPNCIRNDKSIILSGFQGDSKNELPACQCEPLALFLKPLSPAERLAAQQRDHERLQRERQLRELAEEEGGRCC